MNAYKNKQLLEDIYDLVKECALSSKQADSWAVLSHKHADDAKRGIHKFIKNKCMEWDGDKNTINIGQHIVISITYK
jgi:hypothetical protein